MAFAANGRDAARPHVFCVNRSADFLEVLLDLLQEQEGYVATTTASVGTAFAQVAVALPDLVILDVVPGDAEAEHLLSRLTTDEATRPIPVIATSTDPATVERLRADPGRFRPQHYLVKPFDLEELLGAVTALLRVS